MIKEYEERMKKKGKDAKKKEEPVKTAEEEKDEKVRSLAVFVNDCLDNSRYRRALTRSF